MAMSRIIGLAMLVVGVGYPDATTLADTAQIRARDLTPSPTAMFEQSGGADAFVSFIGTELMAWVDDRHPGEFTQSTYFGHSLGGLFGTYVLLERPDLFDRFILSSPSLWWDDEIAFGLEADRAAASDDLAASAVFGIGALETDEGRRIEGANLPQGHPAKPPARYLDMVDDLARFVDQLASRQYASLALDSVVVPDEFHLTVPGVVLSRALRLWSVGSRARIV